MSTVRANTERKHPTRKQRAALLLSVMAALSVNTARAEGTPDRGTVAAMLARCAEPRMSSDSTRVTCAVDQDGDFEIVYVDLAEGTVSQLTHNDWDDLFPVWATGDTLVVFASKAAKATDVHVVGVDGTGERVVAPREVLRYDPAWPAGFIDVNAPPAMWLSASSRGGRRVRLHLTGVFDREDGRGGLAGSLRFGDGTDTTFAALPPYVEHAYAKNGTYHLELHAHDSGGLTGVVLFELTVIDSVRVHWKRGIVYEREKPNLRLDR